MYSLGRSDPRERLGAYVARQLPAPPGHRLTLRVCGRITGRRDGARNACRFAAAYRAAGPSYIPAGLFLDPDGAVHVFVAIAAEDITVEDEGAGLVGHNAYARGLARNDGRAHLEVRRVEAHDDIGAGELEYSGLVELQHDLVGLVGELVRLDGNDALGGEGTDRDASCHRRDRARCYSAEQRP